MKETTKIKINEEVYIKESEIQKNVPEEKMDGMEYCIIRTYSAGVFAGYLESREGKEAVIRNSRCIWYWSGAKTLSELATAGPLNPDKCKFGCVVDKTIVTEVIEIIPCTETAKNVIQEVKIWN